MKEYLSRFTRQELLEKLDMAKTSNAPEEVKKAFIEGLEKQLNMYSVNPEAIKDIIEKYGLQIRVLKSRRIQYKKGDVLGNDITFLEEVEPETLKKSSSSIYLLNIRKAKFKCYCGKDFIQKITLVKNKRVMSCGCYKVQKVKEYHERKKGKK